VRWLTAGSVPAAFAGVLVLRQLGDGATVQARIKQVLGVALLLAASSIAAKGLVQVRATRRAVGAAGGASLAVRPFQLRPLPTVLIGVVGGLVVGMTSVGSGSLMIVMLLLLLYPMLRSSELVGTDLVQAIPLVASAAAGHLLFGDFRLDLTASLLVGSLPGVYLGARLSSRANDAVIRPAGAGPGRLGTEAARGGRPPARAAGVRPDRLSGRAGLLRAAAAEVGGQPWSGWSWASSCSASEMTQYSANRPSSTRRRSWPPKLTRVPAAAVAPGMPSL
jgi:uncharacterized membrane protein YfcA